MSMNLTVPATVDLIGAESVTDLARIEGAGSADFYAAAPVHRIGITTQPLHVHTARLKALAGIATGTTPDNVTAEELAHHYALLRALFERCTVLAADCANSGHAAGSESYARSAFGAPRAALAVLSALQMLREASTRSRQTERTV